MLHPLQRLNVEESESCQMSGNRIRRFEIAPLGILEFVARPGGQADN